MLHSVTIFSTVVLSNSEEYNRDGDLEPRTAILGIGHGDRPAVGPDDLRDDSQSEPGSGGTIGVAETE